jgi:FkbM family methyltransferase
MDSHAPWLASAYRTVRDQREFGSSAMLATPYGFDLAGCPTMASGEFENEEIELFTTLLKDASVCVDVGANIGLYTLLSSRCGKRTIAVEPLAGNLKYLYKNLLHNHAKAEVFPVALGAEPGLQVLYGGTSCASFVKNWNKFPETWNTIVPLSTLDSLVSARFSGEPMLIKIDVEGFEHEVLQGAMSTLQRSPKPTWLVEICLDLNFPNKNNPRFEETFRLFTDLGYEARVADRTQRVIQADDIKRWAAQKHPDFGSINYLFIAK